MLDGVIAHSPCIVRPLVGSTRGVMHMRPEQGVSLGGRPDALVRLQEDNDVGRYRFQYRHLFQCGCEIATENLNNQISIRYSHLDRRIETYLTISTTECLSTFVSLKVLLYI